ncbi:MAG: Mov34/MPN/PAD-1 family protein [Pirellulaceae bacterium]|nr:Mov34/MPN/PAD-1 family protein [Pirellulaceae bacterium]
MKPTLKPAPAPAGSASRHQVGTLHAGAVTIYVHEPVLERILAYSEQELRRELGGFLIGGLHEDGGNYVEIQHYLPAVDARSQVASLTFTHETWSRLRQQVETEFAGQLVLGWHHTHPDLGVFLSGYDLFIHRHFFPHFWQIALVLDPVRREFAFFQWRADEIVDCGFVCVAVEPGLRTIESNSTG